MIHRDSSKVKKEQLKQICAKKRWCSAKEPQAHHGQIPSNFDIIFFFFLSPRTQQAYKDLIRFSHQNTAVPAGVCVGAVSTLHARATRIAFGARGKARQ